MVSPYFGTFRVTQQYKGLTHDGLDIVGVTNKKIHSTINGVVEFAGWENPKNTSQGFGLYVRIKQLNSNDRYYFGHLSKLNVKVGEKVIVGQVIGVEGNTGYSFGSHCHYCCRTNSQKSKHKNISKISGIPNKIGRYCYDVGQNTTFKKYKGNTVSIVEALKSLKINSSFTYRNKIAKANGIKCYLGTPKQNTKLLELLKKGILIKP